MLRNSIQANRYAVSGIRNRLAKATHPLLPTLSIAGSGASFRVTHLPFRLPARDGCRWVPEVPQSNKMLVYHNNYNIVNTLTDSFYTMPTPFPSSIENQPAGAGALGTRMEAAAEALLRFRDEIIATLDRQVLELQQVHRALALPPPPMTCTPDAPVFEQAAEPTAAVTVKPKPSVFEGAPPFALEAAPSFTPVAASAPVAPVRPMSSLVPPAPVAAAPAALPPPTELVASIPAHAAVATVELESPSAVMPGPLFDPLLERATLDELNDALANAFATVSSRSR